MDNQMIFNDQASCSVTKNRKIEEEKMPIRGKFHVEHWRNNVKLSEQDIDNMITNEGRNHILDVEFNTATQVANSSWYIGLIDNSGFSALAAADVMNSHAGWTELQAYTESTRVAWGSGSASSQSVTNASPATFDMNATNTAYGIFVTTVSTKGGTTGKLWATAAFASTVPVNNGDQLKITYTVSD